MGNKYNNNFYRSLLVKIKTIKNLAGVALLATLAACSGSGSCPPNSSGELSLKLTAPDQYPAGRAYPITAYLTMSNTSDVNASNLYYEIPTATNYTNVDITVANDSSNPCLTIPAHQSCTFPVTIGAYAKPGSFTVTAAPNGSAQNSTLTKVKSFLGGSNKSLSLTANIGLTDIPTVADPGNNDIIFLYSKTIVANPDSGSLVSIVGYVNASNSDYNTINLTDKNGNPLNFSVLSGNSGNGLTNLTTGSLVTFLLTIPAGTGGEYDFYAQTMKDGTVVQSGTRANPIKVANATYGVLNVQPSAFQLLAAESYTTQTITYTNIGNGELTGLTIQSPAEPISIASNTCGSSLLAGASCTLVIKSNASPGVSGSGSIVSTYNGGGTTQISASHYNYAGLNAESGISLVASNNFAFTANTVNISESTQVVLTNTGNVNESGFIFSFTPSSYFTITTGVSGTPCSLSGNTVTNTLPAGQSCSITLTYTNNVIGNGSTQMEVNYSYNGNIASPEIKTLTYTTTQATANLLVSPSTYNFGTIIANDLESKTESFVITNSGPDNISAILTSTITGTNAGFFSILSSTGINDCQSKANINVGESCSLTVRFGATATVESNISANISLTGNSASGGAIASNISLTGSTRAPLSASIQVYSITHSASVVAGNGESVASAFQIESTDSVGGSSITLYYKNIGEFAAKDFTVDTSNLPSGYTVDSDSTCGDGQIMTLESQGRNSCYVVLKPNSSTPGALNITLSNLPTSWEDERGIQANQEVSWNTGSSTQNTVYVNIFAPASVSAVLSRSSTGSPVIESVTVDSTFYVVFTLSGGYNVGNKTYTVTTTGGFSPTSGSCVVSSNSPKCSVELTALSVATESTISVSGDPSPSPTSLPISVGYNINAYTYITNIGPSNPPALNGAGYILKCATSQSTGVISDCTTALTGLNSPEGMVRYGDHLYFASVDTSESGPMDVVKNCHIASDGNLENCVNELSTHDSGGFDFNQMAINGTQVYLGVSGGTNAYNGVSVANIGNDGSLSDFQVVSSAAVYSISIANGYMYATNQISTLYQFDLANFNTIYTTSIAQNAIPITIYGSYAYLGTNGNQIWKCSINSLNNYNLENCTSTGETISGYPLGMTTISNYLYTINYDNTIRKCTIDASNGNLSACSNLSINNLQIPVTIVN